MTTVESASKLTVYALLAIVSILSVPSTTRAQSLWERRKPNTGYMFYDTQARQVGDLVTVIINENTDVANRDNRTMDRNVASSGGFGFGGSLSGDFGTKGGEAEWNQSTNGSGKFEGATQYGVQREFSDQITASVVQCLPNGNLVIRGQRTRAVSGETRTLTVSGIIRPLDVRADNSIESRFIGDFRVEYSGTGNESEFTKEGWATRMWNRFRPQ
jgi:flagellar L-ring protein precursor FlgH